MNKIKNYLKDFCKSEKLIISLLFTCFAMTLLTANYIFDITQVLYSSTHVLLLFAICGCVFLVPVLAYILFSLRAKKLTIADAIYMSLILIGVAFFLFFAIALDSINTIKILLGLTLLIAGLVLASIRIAIYARLKSDENAQVFNVKKYCKDVLSKFSFVTIFAICIAVICLTYFLLIPQVIAVLRDKIFMLTSVILILPTLAYAIFNLKNKQLILLDVVALACLFASPIMLSLIIVFSLSKLKLYIWAITMLILGIYLLIRFAYYNPDVKKEKVQKCGYVNSVLSKYNLLMILSIGGLIAFFTKLLITSDVLHPLYAFEKFTFNVNLLPTILLTFIALISLGLFALISLFGVTKKGVGIADLSLAISLSFIAFGLISLIAHPSIYFLIGLSAFLVYSIILLVLRVKKYKKA